MTIITNRHFKGSILEGPDPSNLKPLVEQAMPMLIELLKDPSVAVRDTTGKYLLNNLLVTNLYMKYAATDRVFCQ